MGDAEADPSAVSAGTVGMIILVGRGDAELEEGEAGAVDTTRLDT